MIAGRAPAISGSDDGGSVNRLHESAGSPSRSTSIRSTPSVTNPTSSEKIRNALKTSCETRPCERRPMIGAVLIRRPRDTGARGGSR
jgi:hypothetical protein